jgi:murein DD-endopeptidase MepM/ murein hydrolase activator NlpD
LFRSLSWLRAVAPVLIAIGAAGCSAESARFGEAPYASRGGPGDATGSISSGQQGAPVGHVESRPLPQAAPVASQVTAGGGRGMASYGPPAASYNPPPAAPAAYYSAPPPAPAPAAANYNPAPNAPAYSPAAYHPGPEPEVTGSVTAPASVVRKPAATGQWSWDGGTAITVAPGETVEAISRRHGVPVAVIMEANKLASPNAIQAGQRLVIPRYSPALAAPASVPPSVHASAPAVAPVASKPAPASTASPSPSAHAAGPVNPAVHVVVPGETLTKIARQYGKTVAEIAKANNIPPYGKISIGDRIVIPSVRTSSATPEVEQAAAPAKPPGNKAVAGAAPTQSASMVSPATESPAIDGPVKSAAEPTPGFRWPVRGRIIAGFGPKPNGQQNDGIDVAVPENTPIKAAEDGVVAYAGNELKGYGNLVLVRHPNGYVTAYAHAKELLVKRGDQIKRGDVIAKSGQSGNADAPQLHFEVRKGSAPVDPMQFLNGA